MSTYNIIAAALYGKLSASTALVGALGGTAIYNTLAPDSATYPRVVFRSLAGGPANINPSDMRELIYSVTTYALDKGQAGTIDAIISPLLHRLALTVSGYTNYWTARETEINNVELPPNGAPVFAVGAQYRIRIDN